MYFLYGNLPVLIVAAALAAVAWAFGGTRNAPLIAIVPWLVMLLTEALLFWPQKHPGEATYDARERVWRALKKDPFVWTGLGLLALLAIPFVNNGLCPGCDRVLIAQGFNPDPPIKFLPFCVNRMHHLNVFLWFAASFSIALAIRHALTREGKRLLVEFIVWNGFLLAILGFVQTATDAPGPLWVPMKNVKKAGTFFSTFGYPNMAGDFFTTLFALAMALWRFRHAETDELKRTSSDKSYKNDYFVFQRRHYALIPAVVFYWAALNTLSRAAIILVTTLAVLFFAHAFVSFTHNLRRADRVRRGTIALVVAGLAIFFAVQSIPEDMQREVDTINSSAVLERVTGRGQYHVRVATALWKKHFLFGIGGWGYKHFCRSEMTPEERKKGMQMVGGVNVHNDYLQLLAEHGTVGFGLMAALVGMLLVPLFRSWRQLIRDARFMDKKRLPAKPIVIFALPAPALFVFLGILATLVHGFGDCPLRSAAVMTLFFACLAIIPGFLPRPEEQS